MHSVSLLLLCQSPLAAAVHVLASALLRIIKEVFLFWKQVICRIYLFLHVFSILLIINFGKVLFDSPHL